MAKDNKTQNPSQDFVKVILTEILKWQMTKLKCQIKPKIQKFKVLSVKGLLKNSDQPTLLFKKQIAECHQD